jgi:hypothetical protein
VLFLEQFVRMKEDLSPLAPGRVYPATVRKSLQWYISKIHRLGANTWTGTSALQENIGKLTTQVTVGRMYLFIYDAKHKDTLPYWDRYPLVFPFRPTENGFIGINLHYLPYGARLNLMHDLMQFATTKLELTETSKIRMSWNRLQQFPAAHPCVKRYLTSHIRSRFLEITPQDWKTVSLLPIEGFVGAKKETVFRHSRQRV